jgi:hypothetical protein
MLTVVTQNSRLLRRSALSGDRMAFGFGYPHCSVPDARCQVSPGFLAKSVTCSRQIQPKAGEEEFGSANQTRYPDALSG